MESHLRLPSISHILKQLPVGAERQTTPPRQLVGFNGNRQFTNAIEVQTISRLSSQPPTSVLSQCLQPNTTVPKIEARFEQVPEHSKVGSSGTEDQHGSTRDPCLHCTCNKDKKHQKTRRLRRGYHIPRPWNAFIFFRQYWHQQLFPQERIKQSERGNNSSFKTNCQVSVDIGQRWRSLSAEERQQWLDLAKKEKEEHMRKYPDYKYVPNRRQKKSYSTPNAGSQNHEVKSNCRICTHG